MKSNNSPQRIALVTGASRGIGAGITQYLISKNYHVHATYRNDKDLINQLFSNNPNVTIHHLDVADESEVKQVLSAVESTSGQLHLLVNNAAVDYLVSIEDMSLEQWDDTFNARCRGTFLMTKHSLPLFKKNSRSTIINITSSFASETQPDLPAACAAEAAKMNFTKTCAVALAKYGVRTHSVNPGATRTPLWDNWGVDDQAWAKMAAANPLGRNCTPEDVAKIIFYLDSEEAAYLNGVEIYTNGGNHLRNL